MPKSVKINNRLHSVLTIGELAKLCGRSTGTFQKYEQRGILPPANLRTPGSDFMEGRRLYTRELANTLQKIFWGITQGVEITGEQKRLIAVAFQEEKQRLQ